MGMRKVLLIVQLLNYFLTYKLLNFSIPSHLINVIKRYKASKYFNKFLRINVEIKQQRVLKIYRALRQNVYVSSTYLVTYIRTECGNDIDRDD